MKSSNMASHNNLLGPGAGIVPAPGNIFPASYYCAAPGDNGDDDADLLQEEPLYAQQMAIVRRGLQCKTCQSIDVKMDKNEQGSTVVKCCACGTRATDFSQGLFRAVAIRQGSGERSVERGAESVEGPKDRVQGAKGPRGQGELNEEKTTTIETQYGEEQAPPVSKYRPHKYVFTVEMDEQIRNVYRTEGTGNNQVKCLAEEFSMPRWVVTKRAREIMAYSPRIKEPVWSEPELNIVTEFAYLTPERIRIRLAAAGFKRSTTGIMLKRKRLSLLQHLDGYSANIVADLFGIDIHTILGWIDEGLLQGERRGTSRTKKQGGDTWFIRKSDVSRFISENIGLIDIRKVDKFWFTEMLTAENANIKKEEDLSMAHLNCIEEGCDKQRVKDSRCCKHYRSKHGVAPYATEPAGAPHTLSGGEKTQVESPLETSREAHKEAEKLVSLAQFKVIKVLPSDACFQVDFTGREELIEQIKALAKDDFRTPEEQILFCVYSMIQLRKGAQTPGGIHL